MKKGHPIAAGLLAVTPLAGIGLTTAASAEDTGALAEIVVTAQRRAENLQNVPVSVTAFSGEALDKANVRGAMDYLMETPNVSFTNDKQSGSRGLALAIRGVNNLVTGENAFVNSSGIYLDEFSIASVPNGVANPFLPDMERVEVLRGPQGTTFGRNALGGALNLTSKAPTDKYEGWVKVGAETYDTHGNTENIAAVYNIPVSETFRLRAVGMYEDSTGIVKNVGPGNGAGHKWLNLRLRGSWTPSDATRLNFSVLYGKEHQGADETVPSGVLDLDSADTFVVGVASNPGTGFWLNDNQSSYSADLQQRNDLRTVIATANLAQDFGEHLTWKNIAGVIDSKNHRFFDNDLVGNADILSRTNDYTGKSYSFETRLEGHGTPVTWTVGAMYAQDKQDQFNDVAVSSDPTAALPGYPGGLLPPFPPGLGLALNTKHYKVSSVAGFGDVTWHATDKAELFAGLRFTHDKVTRGLQAYGIAPNNPPSPPPTAGFFQSFVNFARPVVNGDASFNDTTPRIGARYQLHDDVSVYATVSKGYKAGGLSMGNAGGTNAPLAQPFNKETMWNYEVGFKSEFADHRVRLNASLFVMRWKDLQMEAFRFLVPGDLSTNFEQTVNLPKAEAKGAEIELTARPTEHITFGGSIGFLNTEILEDQACAVSALDPDCIGGHKKSTITGGFQVSVKGLPIPNSPKSTLNLFSEYRMPFGNNAAWARVEYTHRDPVYSDIEGLTWQQTTGPSPNSGTVRALPYGDFPYKVPAFDVFNLRGGVDLEHLSFNVYVLNLTGEDYYTGSYQKFGLSGIRLRPNPRTIGASITMRF
ncbi:MAG: TonB-dependent receptor [Steroidobacteraceae bacterium]